MEKVTENYGKASVTYVKNSPEAEEAIKQAEVKSQEKVKKLKNIIEKIKTKKSKDEMLTLEDLDEKLNLILFLIGYKEV